MDYSFYDLIIYTAFETLLNSEDKSSINIKKLHEYRKEILRQMKLQYDFFENKYLGRNEADKVSIINEFISINDKMTKEEEIIRIKEFLKKHSNFTINNNVLSIINVPEKEDFTAERCEIQNEIDRPVGADVVYLGILFESRKIIGADTTIKEVKKIIDIEKGIEQAFLNYNGEYEKSVIATGNYYNRGKIIGLLKKHYQTMTDYNITITWYAADDGLNDLSVKSIISDILTDTSVFYKKNEGSYHRELSDIFIQAIFDNRTLSYSILCKYFNDLWEYTPTDDDMGFELEDGTDWLDWLAALPLDEDDDENEDDDEYDEEDELTRNEELMIKEKFYINYINKINKLYDQSLELTKNRLLYALNYIDSNLCDEKYFHEKLKELNNNPDNDVIRSRHLYVLARLFLVDLIEENFDINDSIKKLIFISTYYELTKDNRILDIFDTYEYKDISKKIYDIVINNNFDHIKPNSVKTKSKKEDS